MATDSSNLSAGPSDETSPVVSSTGHGVSGLGIRVTNLTRTFPADTKNAQPVKVIDALNLTIEPGSFVAMLGPSGCGKSTLLRLIASLDKPTQGQISFHTQPAVADAQATTAATATADTVDVARIAHIAHTDTTQSDIAYVFQDAHLLPWRNVWRNVALPLELMASRRQKNQPKQTRQQQQAVAAQALDRVGLSDAMNRYPAQLSGGMRMRVSLARALVTKPRLLLLDEPFAALDEITRQQLDEQLRQLWRDSGMTVLFVTHATAEATYLAQRAIVLSQRPARVIHDEPIALSIDRPRRIRGEAAFAAASAKIYEALERGELTGSQPGHFASTQSGGRVV